MKNRLNLLRFLLLIITPNVIVAQTPYFTEEAFFDPLTNVSSRSLVELHDWDKDGDDDLVVAGGTNNENMRIFVNNNGDFDSTFFLFEDSQASISFKAMSARDLDNDMDDDILWMSGYGDAFYFFENKEGNGYQEYLELDSLSFGLTANINMMQTADLNKDNLPDIILVDNQNNVYWAENLGGLEFSSPKQLFQSTTSYGGINFLQITDVNDDGWLDFAIKTEGTNLWDAKGQLFLNNSLSSFTIVDYSSIMINSGSFFQFDDFNADGKEDILMTNYNYDIFKNELKIFWNDGDENYLSTNNQLLLQGSNLNFQLIEIDSTTGPDFAASSMIGANQFLTDFYTFNESEILVPLLSSPIKGISYPTLLQSDLDKDGNGDIIAAEKQRGYDISAIKFNEGSYSRDLINYSMSSINRMELVTSDVTGHKNLYISGDRGSSIGDLYLHQGNGNGEFQEPRKATNGFYAYEYYHTPWYDMNTTSTLVRSQDYIFCIDSTKFDTLFDASILGLGYSPQYLIAGDIDNDNDMDLFVQTGQGLVWIENEGYKNYTYHGIDDKLPRAYFQLIDVNNDNYLDFVKTGDATGELQTYLFNPTNGEFNPVEVVSTLSGTNLNHHFDLKDLSGDNIPDLIFQYNGGIAYAINNGSGVFENQTNIVVTGSNIFPSTYTGHRVIAKDMNNDGNLDIVSSDNQSRLLLAMNQGSNTFEFSYPMTLPACSGCVPYLFIADVDEDGNEDILSEKYNIGHYPIWYKTCFYKYSDTTNLEGCENVSWRGQSFTQSGLYSDTIATESCDSIITVNIIVNTVSDNSITVNGNELSANNLSATYQWLDCDNNTLIDGAIDQLFSASTNGNYAVELTENGCKDTSVCELISITNMDEAFRNDLIEIYPNPSNGSFSIQLDANIKPNKITVSSINGELIRNLNHESNIINFTLDKPSGIYLLSIETPELKTVFRLIKQ